MYTSGYSTPLPQCELWTVAKPAEWDQLKDELEFESSGNQSVIFFLESWKIQKKEFS